MSASSLPVAAPAPSGAPSLRALRALGALGALGASGMLGGPMFLVHWVAGGGTAASLRATTTASSLLGMPYLAGWAASAGGMRRQRATGRGRGGAALLAALGVGPTLAFCQQAQDLAGRHPLGEALHRVCDVAWPASHALMLAVGVATLRAGAWAGWRRWTPLACGLVLPAAVLAAATRGPDAMAATFAVGTAAAFLALGCAVRSAPVPRRG